MSIAEFAYDTSALVGDYFIVSENVLYGVDESSEKHPAVYVYKDVSRSNLLIASETFGGMFNIYWQPKQPLKETSELLGKIASERIRPPFQFSYNVLRKDISERTAAKLIDRWSDPAYKSGYSLAATTPQYESYVERFANTRLDVGVLAPEAAGFDIAQELFNWTATEEAKPVKDRFFAMIRPAIERTLDPKYYKL